MEVQQDEADQLEGAEDSEIASLPELQRTFQVILVASVDEVKQAQAIYRAVAPAMVSLDAEWRPRAGGGSSLWCIRMCNCLCESLIALFCHNFGS